MDIEEQLQMIFLPETKKSHILLTFAVLKKIQESCNSYVTWISKNNKNSDEGSSCIKIEEDLAGNETSYRE